MWFLECCHKHLNFTQYQDTPEQYRLIRKKKKEKKNGFDVFEEKASQEQ